MNFTARFSLTARISRLKFFNSASPGANGRPLFSVMNFIASSVSRAVMYSPGGPSVMLPTTCPALGRPLGTTP